MSQPIRVSIPHQLGAAEARARIEAGFGQLERQIGGGLAQVHKRWDGDTLDFSAKAMGQAVTGRLQVLARTVEMEIELPPILAMLADTLKGRLKTQGRLLLK